MNPELLACDNVIDGRYRLVRAIGEGGMGWVWEASHVFTGKRYALKLLKRTDEAHRRRFEREARAVAAIDHPNVVAVHDFIVLPDGLLVMVMDRLDGESFGSVLARVGAVELPQLAAVLLPVTSALGAAHAAGIVHRDLKPDNIFIVEGPSGREVKVLDFGTAKLLPSEARAAESRKLTTTGAIVGTPYYMSPEQVLAETDVDARADIWALGVILYEGLSGVRPSEGETVGKVLKRILTGDLEPIASRCPSLPSDIATLIDRMLRVERSERPSLMEVRERLAVHAGDRISLPPVARASIRVSTSKRTDPHADTQQASAISVVAAKQTSRRWPFVLLGALSLAAVAAAVWVATRPPTANVAAANDAASPHPCDALAAAKLDAKGLVRMQLVKRPAGSCFWIDRTEVTVEQWRRFRAEGADAGSWAKATGCSPDRPLSDPESAADACGAELSKDVYASLPTKPVRCVDWCDARAFCQWAGKELCASPNKWRYSTVDSTVLDDEWGVACSPTGEAFPYGRTLETARCNAGICEKGSQVGGCEVANVGAYHDCHGETEARDMAGNVSEWVLACVPGATPGAEKNCAHRGGSYREPVAATGCQTDNRFVPRSTRAPDLGFRCCAPLTRDEELRTR